jgi:hypothetical protein
MTELDTLLDEAFVGQERLTRDDLQRHAVASGVSSETAMAIDGLPEGEYTVDEVEEALNLGRGLPAATDGGIPAEQLDDLTLRRELEQLHRTRHETFLHGSEQALQRHTERTAELEAEYLRRQPEREVDEDRLRSGARARAGEQAD